MNYCANPFFWQRRITREVKVGHVGVGGDNPIRVQTMLISDTMNTDACVEEAIPIIEAGCEILRITAPSINDAKNLKNIAAELRKCGLNTPIVADIHFVPVAAMEAAEWVEKVRINPGNYADRKKFATREYSDDQYAEELERLEKAFTPLVLKCKQLGRAMRIGTNHGSLSDRIMNRYGDTPLGMVESALEFARICRKNGYHDFIFSMKASNPKVMIEAYRMLVARLAAEGSDWNYPLHLGVTEAGEGEDGRIKSAIGIGALLEDGIGDTVRVSLTEDSVHEIPVCKELVKKYNGLWGWQESGKLVGQPPSLQVVEKRNPFSYFRRETPQLQVGALALRVGREHPPRVEVPVPLTATVSDIQRITTAEPDTFAEILQFHVKTMADIGKLVALKPKLRAHHIETPIAVRLDSAEIVLPVTDVAEKLNVPYTGKENITALLADANKLTLQFDVEGESPELFVNNCNTLAGVLNMFPEVPVLAAVGRVEGLDVIGAYRILAAKMPERVHILLRDRVSSRRGHHVQQSALIAASTHLGALICDGIGDAVEITGEDDLLKSVKLAYNILQAANARTFKTDYVACPSCGRTLFDLQTVTARIKSRTSHLKGVKIAVMGCIVNGPGEMADADFGYVGTAPGKISLWVGKTQVKQHIPEDQAVDELIALIKEHDKWIDAPATETGTRVIKPWHIQRSEPVFEGRVFKVRKDVTVNPRTGQTHDMFVLEQPNWVNVIPLTPDEQVVMIEQWRHGTRTVELETPGGLMDAGETPEQCGRRELLEETGYESAQIVHLGAVHPNPALQGNTQHYLLATGCRKVADLDLDHAEDIVVRLVPLREVPALIRTGQITHSIVIGGFYWLNDYRSRHD